jgi:prenyltransferase beta subunit
MKETIPPRKRRLPLPPPVAAAASETMAKAIAHVLSVQEENGAWSRLRVEFPAEAEPTSWAVKVFSSLRSEAKAVERGLSFIMRDQREDGSWNGNSAHTAFAICALLEAGKGADATDKAVEYLRKVQGGEGGFTRMGGEGQTLTVYTANVLFALAAAGLAKGDPMVDKALTWLRSRQGKDGGFAMTGEGDSIALATTWTMRALRALGAFPSDSVVKTAREWLLGVQRRSGGFSMTGQAREDPEVTSLAICALLRLPHMEKTLERAVAYLCGAQEGDGSFTSSMPMQFNNVAKKNTQTTLFVIWALSEWASAAPRPA